MSNETEIVVITPRTFDEAKSMSSALAKASLLPQALRGKEADVLMTIMAGAELGLGPILSIRAIHVIEGKPTLSADLIAALCLRRPDVCEYIQPTESSATKATYTAKRKRAPGPVTMSFSIDDARQAGLAGKGNWAKYPAAMLRARCVSAICRAVFPDLVGGLYDSDSAEIEPHNVTPPTASPPSGVVDAVATVVPAPALPDYAANGAPISEATKLEVALEEAQDVAALNALVDRLGRIKGGDAKTYARLRERWGARRNELMAAAKVDMAVQAPRPTPEPRVPGMEG